MEESSVLFRLEIYIFSSNHCTIKLTLGYNTNRKMMRKDFVSFVFTTTIPSYYLWFVSILLVLRILLVKNSMFFFFVIWGILGFDSSEFCETKTEILCKSNRMQRICKLSLERRTSTLLVCILSKFVQLLYISYSTLEGMIKVKNFIHLHYYFNWLYHALHWPIGSVLSVLHAWNLN
jgi:hypothetical protein